MKNSEKFSLFLDGNYVKELEKNSDGIYQVRFKDNHGVCFPELFPMMSNGKAGFFQVEIVWDLMGIFEEKNQREKRPLRLIVVKKEGPSYKGIMALEGESFSQLLEDPAFLGIEIAGNLFFEIPKSQGKRYAEDKPLSCRQCRFWEKKQCICRLEKENCYYLLASPKVEKPKHPCAGCPYAIEHPCIGYCLKEIQKGSRQS